MHFRFSLLEIFLGELTVWFLLWLINDYLAALLTIIITAIVFSVLAVALLSEWIERSRVPRFYFFAMALSVVAPLLAATVYTVSTGGSFNFLLKPFGS